MLSVEMTALWSVRYGPGAVVITLDVFPNSLITKSNVFPCLCVGKVTC